MGTNFLGILSFLADLTPLILFFVFLRILKDKVFLILFIWTLISVASDILIANYSSEKQQVIVFFAIIAEMLFVATIFFIIVKIKLIKLLIILLSLIYIVLFVNEICKGPIVSFPYDLASITVLLTLVLSLLVFYDLYKMNITAFLLENAYIYLIFGYLIYVAGNLFLFATTEKFPNIFAEPGLWSIFILANIIKNCFISVAIYKKNISILKM